VNIRNALVSLRNQLKEMERTIADFEGLAERQIENSIKSRVSAQVVERYQMSLQIPGQPLIGQDNKV
jgi:hypothetical protein